MQAKHKSYIRKISAIISLVGIIGILSLQVGSWLTTVSSGYMHVRSVEIPVDDTAFILPLGGGVSGHLLAFVRAYRLHWLLYLSIVLTVVGGVIFLISLAFFRHSRGEY